MIHRAELFCDVKPLTKMGAREVWVLPKRLKERERAFSENPREYGLREAQLAQQRAIPDAKEAVSRLSTLSIQFILLES